MASNGGVKNSAMVAGRGLARARNQGASYARGGMLAMPQAAVAAPKKTMRGKALPMAMKKGGKC
jgi:hypothetical protein